MGPCSRIYFGLLVWLWKAVDSSVTSRELFGVLLSWYEHNLCIYRPLYVIVCVLTLDYRIWIPLSLAICYSLERKLWFNCMLMINIGQVVALFTLLLSFCFSENSMIEVGIIRQQIESSFYTDPSLPFKYYIIIIIFKISFLFTLNIFTILVLHI